VRKQDRGEVRVVVTVGSGMTDEIPETIVGLGMNEEVAGVTISVATAGEMISVAVMAETFVVMTSGVAVEVAEREDFK
jgi:hypothetical protein